MTEIFLFMWAADVAQKIGFVVFLLWVVWGLSLAVGLGLLCVMAGEEGEDCVAFRKIFPRSMVWSFVFLFVMLGIPRGDTLRLMAAAKAGDVLVHTQTGGKAVEAVNAVLDKIIAASKDDKK